MLQAFQLQTPKQGFIDITKQVHAAIAANDIYNGICLVYCPHTTAGITINENADPDVLHDLLLGLEQAFPEQNTFRHMEGNSTAHLKASCMGASVTVPVSDGQLLLGMWQGIYFCEFDGPRNRRFFVKGVQG